jgi:hypothetical protein
MTGRLDESAAAKSVMTELRRTKFRSLRIASILPALVRRTTDVEVFRNALNAVKDVHPDIALYQLELHLAMLELDFERATDIAVKWALATLFDVDAMTVATFLLAEVRGDYDAALSLGKVGLLRMPAAHNLANNVAYAIALSGRPRDARQFVPQGIAGPHVAATEGLIDILEGRVAAGLQGYERAREYAKGNAELEVLVLLHRNLALWRLGGRSIEAAGLLKEYRVQLPSGWREVPNFHLLRRRMEEEGLAWPG